MTVGRTTDTAGAGSPAPAVSSAQGDVVPPSARVELDRIRRRWGELPLETAAAWMPSLRHLLVDLARRSAPGHDVPDLGPAVVVDQLAVVVWDAYAARCGDGIPELLTDARRALG